LFDFLIKYSDVNATDGEGNTPLIIAAKTAQTELVLPLLQWFGDRCVTNLQGETALSIAAATSNTCKGIVDMFLKWGPDGIPRRSKDARCTVCDTLFTPGARNTICQAGRCCTCRIVWHCSNKCRDDGLAWHVETGQCKRLCEERTTIHDEERRLGLRKHGVYPHGGSGT
jgi:hypothetical protein